MTIWEIFTNLFFPENCIICEKSGNYLCRDCFQRIPIKPTNFCPFCQNIETFAGRTCNICENNKKNIYLDGVIVASYYRHPILKDLIYRYKFGFIQKLAWPSSLLLTKKIYQLETFPFEDFVFSAVPLHSKRERWRGFNQSVLLGKKLQKFLSQEGLNVEFIPDLLIRNKYKKPQTRIHSNEEREKNIINSFSVNKPYSLNTPRRIILIDDVITTGATLNECAKILKKHGVMVVWGLVLARQGR